MKKIFTYMSFAVVLAVSCNKTEINDGHKGMGALSLEVDMVMPTKAAMSQEELLSTSSVKIYKANHKGLVRSYTYSDMPSTLYLAADEYRVDVEAGEAVKAEPAPASWDQKSYKGSETFTINAGVVSNIEVVANVHNAVTQIAFDGTIAENFNSGYTFTIGLDSEDPSTQLVYDASKSGSEGYFIVAGLNKPSLTWTFTGTLLKDGSEFTRTGTIPDVQTGHVYKMNLKYTIKDGELGFTLMVDYSTDLVDDTIIFEPVSTGLASTPVYEIWAGHATVYADVDATEYENSTVTFEYSADGSVWESAEGDNYVEGSWKAVLTDLSPSTTYRYRLMIDGVQAGEEKTFTTEDAPTLPNGSFEYVSNVSGRDWYKFYDPDCGVEGATTKFWASGNGDEQTTGSVIPGSVAVITVPDEADFYDGKRSVRAQSQSAFITIAAGNLFTGQFMNTVGTSGGVVNFGRPWTSRPTALKIHYKYTTGTMDYVDSSLPSDVNFTKGTDYDRAQIKVAIGTWTAKEYGGSKDSPVQVNTTDESTFVDFYTDPNTIANGDIIIYRDGVMVNKGAVEQKKTDTWQEEVIPLDYRNLTTYPTHIIISCAASQYGDYFTGSTSSKLWLDAFELIYE